MKIYTNPILLTDTPLDEAGTFIYLESKRHTLKANAASTITEVA